MPRPGFPLTIMEFQERFASEEACREYLFACRWPDWFCCRRCGGGEVGHAAFRTLLGLSTHHQPSSYRQIIDHAA